ncbi:KinB-signaling pathway activation protein [Paenibacillus thalictri]|uniref:KinB signaling pathway activation protein n=1 Tax=Paenibacillus thalictri TaxID=2527873 RepID=A0A4Q9DFT8_9BACL|nr:KinB-signaling pathway activation protein [Paenibacillus thalictri]TBL69224.1 KinB signaling pathway activation protein [Paenibacillus thalictri]
MTLRKWFHLFWTTLLLGGAAGGITGILLSAADKEFAILGVSGMGYNVMWMIIGGATISVLSQMGFFAYLIVRFIVMGIIRNKWTWDFLQILFVLIALFDLVYLRYTNFAQGETIWGYMVLPLIMLIVALATAYWKAKLTNKNGFVPTLFFMLAVTSMEAVPALKLNSSASTLYMLIPLIVCNAWQILILHKILADKKEPA